MGKGASLVPVIFPRSIEIAISFLADKSKRQNAGVANKNDFLFPYTQYSEDGSMGYNEIRDVCEIVQIPTVTATAMPHRASTLFLKIEELSESWIRTFMEHKEHSI